jgi:hypothetical protein
VRSGRQAIEEKEDKRMKKEKRNKKEAGTAFRSLLHVLQTKSAEQGRTKELKPVEREGRKR